MQRIAVWNTAFLGDAVLTLPVLQSLRQRYPDAVIDFYVRGGLAALFQAHPAIDNVFAYDKRGKERGAQGFAALARTLAARRYSLWISAHSSLRSALLAFASRAPVRIGYAGAAGGRLWYTRTVERGFAEQEEIERLMCLLTPLGHMPETGWPEVFFAPEAVQAAERFFAGLKGPVLGMHPGSVWGTKCWLPEYFAEIAARALGQGADVLLFAGPGEENIAATVYDAVAAMVEEKKPPRLHNLAGRLSLPLLAAHLGRLSCYLTNDSGPMHLAWAQRTPVTAVFGPTVRSLGFFPRGELSRVFEVALSCRPCGLHGPAVCPLKHHHCMRKVEPEAVWADVRQKLWPHALSAVPESERAGCCCARTQDRSKG